MEDSQEYRVAIPWSNAGSYKDCADYGVEYHPEQMLLHAGFVPISTAQRFGVEPASSEEDASIHLGLRH